MTFCFRSRELQKNRQQKLVVKHRLFYSRFPFDQQIFNALSPLSHGPSCCMIPVLVDNLSVKTIIIPTCRSICIECRKFNSVSLILVVCSHGDQTASIQFLQEEVDKIKQTVTR